VKGSNKKPSKKEIKKMETCIEDGKENKQLALF